MQGRAGKYTYKKNVLRSTQQGNGTYIVKIISYIGLILLLVLTLGGCAGQTDAERTSEGMVSTSGERDVDETVVETRNSAQKGKSKQASENGRLQIHFLDIGQGDCTLITCEESAMLIDAGNNDRGIQVQNYLQKQGIKKLDYVIGTHPDADHIGGLDVILYKFDCGTILLPDYEKDTKTYEEVVQTMKAKNQKRKTPVAGDKYQLGSAEFTIINPGAGVDYGDNTNDYSIGIRVVHGENTFLLTGDAEEGAEADMLKSGLPLSADVYKASHHGSRTASTEAFLKKVNPSYAVISCGIDNSYGHPHAEVLNRFRQAGIQVFRTDEQGTILLTSDGSQITWNCSPDESWKAGEPGKADSDNKESNKKNGKENNKTSKKASTKANNRTNKQENSNAKDTKTEYVLNTNTKKYHLPSCSSVATIEAKNRRDEKTTPAALKAEGYTACKRCLP